MNTADPILFIGGVGGSGTRVVAALVRQLGIPIGVNLNKSLDNLDWPGRRSVLLDRKLTDAEKLELLGPGFTRFAIDMASTRWQTSNAAVSWATKVPGSFYYLPYVCSLFSDVRYIHVVRNGLDMAFSGNGNQARNWSPFFLDDAPTPDTPRSRLRYWASANTLAAKHCDDYLPGRNLWVRMEDLCERPFDEISRLATFLQTATPASEIDRMTELVDTPDSIGRYQELSSESDFDASDLAAVRRLGYGVTWPTP